MFTIDYTPYKFRDNLELRFLDWESLSANPRAVYYLSHHKEKINWFHLSSNPNAILLLEQHQGRIDWSMLCQNTNAIHLIEANLDKVIKNRGVNILSENPEAVDLFENNQNVQDKIVDRFISKNPRTVHSLDANPENIDWTCLSSNPNAVHLLEQNVDKIDWCQLSKNPNAIHLLEKNLDKVYWDFLSENENSIPLLEKNLDKINWSWLSFNPNAIHLIEQNLDKIDWSWLSFNPNAIYLIEQNQDKIDWDWLSQNKNAIHLLRENPYDIVDTNLSYNDIWNEDIFDPRDIELLTQYPEELNWDSLSETKVIFEIDYQVLKDRIEPFKEELIQKCFHPDRLVRYLDTYNYDIGEDEYLD